MAFDAGFLAAVAEELRRVALGARIEKVYQPERDAIVLQMRSFEGGKRLLINAGSTNPRIGFTEIPMENPQNPPMFCVLLRKHLSGAKLLSVEQLGFERVLCLSFETRDEMGYTCLRRLYAEIMGKYSNLIFTDGDGKIMAVLRPVDFTTSSLRQVLPGMRYELPPPQNKKNPLETAREEFLSLLGEGGDRPGDKWLTATFLGVSAAVAREIVYRAAGESDASLLSVDREKLADVFMGVFGDIKAERFAPSLAQDENDKPLEYAFLPLTHYGKCRAFDSASAMLDFWFGTRDQETRVHQRAADVLKLLSNARARI